MSLNRANGAKLHINACSERSCSLKFIKQADEGLVSRAVGVHGPPTCVYASDMAKKTIETFYSDLSGKEIEDGGTVSFGFDGTSYEIDLTATERAAFEKAFEPYTGAARKITAARRGRSAASSSHDPKAIRQWAAENKIDVPTRGRIPASVVEAYQSAN